MISAATILHRILGTPRVAECEETSGRCWHCGADMTRGCPVERWMGANFVGQNRVRNASGTHVCEPCLYVMARNSAVPGRSGNWRNYSVLVEGNTLLIASKAEKPLIREWLRRDTREVPWFAAIGETGQKHTVPYAWINPRCAVGAVQFDERRVFVGGDWRALDDATALLTLGATKDELARGSYRPRLYEQHAAPLFDFERRYAPLRGSPWWALIFWLAQREEGTDGDRGGTGDVESIPRRGTAAASRRVPRSRRITADALGSDPRPDARSGQDERDGCGMGYGDGPNAATPGARESSIG